MINPEEFFNSLSASEQEGCWASMGAYGDCAEEPSIIVLQISEELLEAKDFGSLEVIGLSEMGSWGALEEVLPEGEIELHKLDFNGSYIYIALLYCNGKYVTSSIYEQESSENDFVMQFAEGHATPDNRSEDESSLAISKRQSLQEDNPDKESINQLAIEDPVLLIRLTKTFSPSMTEEELYEATRGNWAISMDKAQVARHAYALNRGEVIQVYNIEYWSETEEISGRGTHRIRFTGTIASDRQHHIGCSLAHYFKRGEASPTKLLNCNLNGSSNSIPYSRLSQEGDKETAKDRSARIIDTEGNNTCQGKVSEIAQYLKSAERGNVAAQFELGCIYANGEGVEQDNTEAFRWFLEAAKQAYKHAQCRIGLMHEIGLGIEQNQSEAFKWYLKAADQGNVEAQQKLGEMYRWGTGVEQDDAKALEWFLKAASQESPDAQYSIGCIYEEGSGVQDDIATAFSWYFKAAEQGDSRAQYAVGCQYRAGEGVDKDAAKALKWYRKAAEQGHLMAMFRVGWMHENAEGCEINNEEALYWYTKAAESGDASAQLMLGYTYEYGLGVKRNHEKARIWLTKEKEQPESYAWSTYMGHAEEGNAKAQYILGCLYSEGRVGLEPNETLAHEWLLRSAEQRYSPARTRLESLGLSEQVHLPATVDKMGKQAASNDVHQSHGKPYEWIRKVLNRFARMNKR